MKTKAKSPKKLNVPRAVGEIDTQSEAPADTVDLFLQSEKGQKYLSMPPNELKAFVTNKHKDWFDRNYGHNHAASLSPTNRKKFMKSYIKYLKEKNPEEAKEFLGESVLDIIAKYKNWLRQVNKPLID